MWLVLGLVFLPVKGSVSGASRAAIVSEPWTAPTPPKGRVNLCLTQRGGSVAFPSSLSVLRYGGGVTESYDRGSKRPTVVCK